MLTGSDMPSVAYLRSSHIRTGRDLTILEMMLSKDICDRRKTNSAVRDPSLECSLVGWQTQIDRHSQGVDCEATFHSVVGCPWEQHLA